MNIDVRLATAHDRVLLDQFYSREGIDFSSLNSHIFRCTSQETMFIVASTEDMIVAAMKLDISIDSSKGKVGYIQLFEIEDELEETDLGKRMLTKAVEIAEEKRLRALDAIVSEERIDVIELYLESLFEEKHKEIHLRRNFRERVF